MQPRHRRHQPRREFFAGQIELLLWQGAYGKPKDVQDHDGEVTLRVEYDRGVEWREELEGRLDKIVACRVEAAKIESVHAAAGRADTGVTGPGTPC